MADLSTVCGGIKSPNPFWLASGPPSNTGDQVKRAFEAGAAPSGRRSAFRSRT
jgi:dihydropyrimidine dehydrogenase (NAD+) subunit PreA